MGEEDVVAAAVVVMVVGYSVPLLVVVGARDSEEEADGVGTRDMEGAAVELVSSS